MNQEISEYSSELSVIYLAGIIRLYRIEYVVPLTAFIKYV